MAARQGADSVHVRPGRAPLVTGRNDAPTEMTVPDDSQCAVLLSLSIGQTNTRVSQFGSVIHTATRRSENVWL